MTNTDIIIENHYIDLQYMMISTLNAEATLPFQKNKVIKPQYSSQSPIYVYEDKHRFILKPVQFI